MSDPLLVTFRAIVHDLKVLISEERENRSTLFTSALSAERFVIPTISLPRLSPLETRQKAPKAEARHQEEAPLPPPKKEPPVAPLPKKQPVVLPELEKKTEDKQGPPPFFVLEPPPLPESSLPGQKELTKRIQKVFPGWKLIEHPPSDEEAMIIASAWKIRKTKAEVIVLLFSSTSLESAFLQNLSIAINLAIAPAQHLDAHHIEEKKLWNTILEAPHLKAVYAPPLETWNAPHLLQYVKTIPATGKSFLGSCPLYFLEAPRVYLNSPLKKRLLWQEICNHCS